MKKRTRILAFCLSAALMFGNVTPAYAAEITPAEEVSVVEEEIAETEEVPVVEEEIAETEEVPIIEEEIVEEEEIQQLPTFTAVYVNPLYEDVVIEDDLLAASGIATMAEDAEYVTSTETAGEILKSGMIARNETIQIYYEFPSELNQDSFEALSSEIFSRALLHTGNPVEGDYIAWQYGGYSIGASGYSQNGVNYLTITYNVTYYTTAEQEAVVDQEIANVLANLALDGKSDYEKVKAIYDFICGHVTYDYANLNDDTYKLKHTAYAALINKTSVCQGYALLFYRLALEEGIDSRIITGWAGENHAWNIVELDDLYYNLDATWDTGKEDYDYIYFLQNMEGFSDHFRADEYLTDEFHAKYPMGESDYVFNQGGEDTETPDFKLNVQKDSDGNAKYIVVTNNSAEDKDYELFLVSEDGKEHYFGGCWVEAGSSGKLRIADYAGALRDIGAGDYSILVRPWSSDDESDCIKLQDFTITVLHEKLEKTTLALGDISGNWYFTDFLASDYEDAYMTIYFEELLEDGTTGAGNWTLSIYNDEIEYLYCDIYSLAEGSNLVNYELEKLEAVKVDSGSDHTKVTWYETSNFKETVFEENQLAAPSVEVLKDGNGNIYGLNVTNNNSEDVDICIDIVPEGADVVDAKYNTNYWIDGNDIEKIYLEELVDGIELIEAGNYYLTIYAMQWNSDIVPSAHVKVKDCQIVVSDNKVSNVQIDVGDDTGDYYFTEYSTDEYDYAWVNLKYIYDGSEETEIWRLSHSRGDNFSFNPDNIPEYWESYEIADFIAVQSYGEGNCYYVEETIGDTFSYGVWVEPKIPAPSMDLYRDGDGDIVGVTVTNNITDNKGVIHIRLASEDTYAEVWIQGMNAGETKNIPFEKLHLFDIEELEHNENLRLQCYADDYELEYLSPVTTLDYNIEVITTEYSGAGVNIAVEEYDEEFYYYLPVEELPENASVQKIKYRIVDEYDEWYGSSSVDLTNDEKYWMFDSWRGLDNLTPTGVIYNFMSVAEEGLTFEFVEIPEEKVNVTSRTTTEENVFFLDYDHYQAFVASGGSISIDAEKGLFENITDGFKDKNNVWSLEYLLESFIGTDAYDVINLFKTSLLNHANKYWKSKEGSFQPVALYDTSGNEFVETNITDTDIVLVKYEPEIVWVDSMQLTAPEQIDLGATGTVTAQLDEGQDKYPFKETPEVRFESSNPEIATVDPVTGVVTAGNVDGIVTITAYADETLRAEEGLDEIVTASIQITIGEGVCHSVTLHTNGGIITTGEITKYPEAFGLVLPTEVVKPGYTFEGWYENSTFKGDAVEEIPAGSKDDKVFYAKWSVIDYTISYALNGGMNHLNNPSIYTVEDEIVLADAERVGFAFLGWFDADGNQITKIGPNKTGNVTVSAKWGWDTTFTLVPADTEVVIPYENGAWTSAVTHVSLESDPIGYTIDNSKGTVFVTDPTGNPVDVTDYNFEVTIPGTYTVTAQYQYGTEATDVATTNTVEITAVYGKRPYPVNQEISWNGISNLDSGLKFEDIVDEIADELTANIKLNEEIGETMREGSIAIKNSKGKYVYNDKTNAAISNGTYKVIYTLSDYNADTEERFFETAEADLTINYTAIGLKDFVYSLAEEEAESGRIAGTTIAAPVWNEEKGEYVNNSSYATAVVITPIFTTLDHEFTAEELREADYDVQITVAENKEPVLTISEEENGSFIVSGDKETTKNLTVEAVIGDDVTLTKTIKNFKVVSGGTNVVKELSVEILDETGVPIEVDSEEGKTDVYLMKAENMAANKVSYALNVNVEDFAGESYEGRLKDAKLKWTTSNKKLAEVKVDKEGNATLNINKGAVGTVDLTVTAGDVYKQSYTFKLFILDTEVRVDSTKLTMNSYLEEPGILKIYPNVAALEDAGRNLGEDWDVEITVDDENETFVVDTDSYNKETGELAVWFVDEEATTNKPHNLKLTVRQHVGDFETEEELTFKITNKKAKPKLTLKAVSPYNAAYKNEAAYAEMLITLGAEVAGTENDPKIHITSEYFGVESLEKVSDTQWSAKLFANENVKTNKKYDIAVEAGFEGYRVTNTASVKMSVTNKTPSMNVYGNEINKPTLYPQLAFEKTKVLIALPEGIVEEGMYADAVDGVLTLGNTEISLPTSVAKNFEIVAGEFISDGTTIDKKGNVVIVENAALVTVRTKTGKTASVQFMVENSEVLASAVKTKSLSVSCAKVTSVAMSMLSAQTGKKTTSVTLLKSAAGKELLTLVPSIPEQILNIYEMNGMNPSDHLIMKVEPADKNAATALGKTLIVEQNADGNMELKTTADLFNSSFSSCKVKFTVYATNEGVETALKSSTLTVKLQKKDTTVSVKAAVKGNLNVVDSDSSVTVTPTFKNLPLGAEIIGVEFVNNADASLYKINDIQKNSGILTIGKRSSDTVLPIAKNSVPLVYKIQLMGGTTVTAEAAVKINVTQTAAVKADVKSITLYNSVIGASYGKEVVFTETKAGATIKDIVFTGLEKSGIAAEQSTGDNGERIVNFYVDDAKDRGMKKTYNVKANVTLEGAGTKKGKEVTYAVSLKIVLNN